MKKFFAVLLTLCLMLALCACDSGENTPETTAVADASIGTEAIETTAAPEQTEAPVVQEEGFCLTFNGVELGKFTGIATGASIDAATDFSAQLQIVVEEYDETATA